MEEKQGKNYDKHTMAKMIEEVENGRKVYMLQKALYGLKQADHQCKELNKALDKLGMHADNCVYFAKRGEDCIIILVYVDTHGVSELGPDEGNKARTEEKI